MRTIRVDHQESVCIDLFEGILESISDELPATIIRMARHQRAMKFVILVTESVQIEIDAEIWIPSLISK